MKRETLRHPKTLDLAARLSVDRPTALGYLTLLWDFAADMAIQGDIGKWADGSIARACDWMGDPAEFMAALTDSGWVDFDTEHRLLVHDWPDHCERWVHLKLKKLGLDFVGSGCTEASTERSIEPTTERSTGASPPRDQTKPNQTKPLPPLPPQGDATNSRQGEGGGGFLEQRIRNAGVQLARKALEVSKLPSAKIHELIDEFEAKPSAWDPGALYGRIVGDLDDWPEPREAYQRAQARETRDYWRGTAKAEKAAEIARQRQLEDDHGPTLDAMSESEQEALAGEIGLEEFCPTTLRRITLLGHLAKRTDERSPADSKSNPA